MKKGAAPMRWLRAFPRAWRDRYGDELGMLVDELRAQGDLRSSDRIDMVRRGLAMRRRGFRWRSVHVTLGVAAGTVCALVGLASAGTFGSHALPSSHAQRYVIELHTHGDVVSAQRIATLCHVTAQAGKVRCPKAITTIRVTVLSP